MAGRSSEGVPSQCGPDNAAPSNLRFSVLFVQKPLLMSVVAVVTQLRTWNLFTTALFVDSSHNLCWGLKLARGDDLRQHSHTLLQKREAYTPKYQRFSGHLRRVVGGRGGGGAFQFVTRIPVSRLEVFNERPEGLDRGLSRFSRVHQSPEVFRSRPEFSSERLSVI